MKLKYQNFLSTKKSKGLKRLECWNGFIICNLVTLPPPPPIGEVIHTLLFHKVIEKYLGDGSIRSFEKLGDDYSPQAGVDGGRDCHCKYFHHFTGGNGIPEWQMSMVSI